MPANRKSNFIRQGTILAMASIFVRLIGIVYRIPVANIIGDEGNGIYGSAYQIYNLALNLSTYSLPLVVSKLLSSDLASGNYYNAQKTFHAALIFSCVSGGIMALLIFFGADFIEEKLYSNFTGIAVPLKVLSITIFVVALLGAFRGFFQSRKTMIPTAISQIIEQIINAICSVVFALAFIKAHKDSVRMAAWGAAGSTMGTLLGAFFGLLFLILVYFLYRPLVYNQFRKDKSKAVDSYGQIFKLLLVTVLPVVIGQAIYQSSAVIDSMLFSNLGKGDKLSTIYGIYNTKYQLLVNVPIAISSAMGSSMIPTFVASFKKGDKYELKHKLSISVKVNMIIAFPCAVGLAALGTPIVKMLFPGSDFDLGGKLLLFGSLAVVFYALSTVTNAALQGIDMMRRPMYHAAISLIIHILLVLLLMNFTNLGIFSLVIGNITYPLVVCLLNAYTLKKKLRYRQEYVSSFIIPAVSSLIMGGAAYLIYRLGYSTTNSNVFACLFAIAVAVVIYFVLIIVFGALKKEDLPDFPMGMRIGRIASKLRLM